MSPLVGLANNTKWSELQARMSGAGTTAPYWRTCATNGFVYPPTGQDGDWTYHFRLGGYETIEWCEMTPRGSPGCIGVDEVESICREIGFEFERTADVVRIIGYRRV